MNKKLLFFVIGLSGFIAFSSCNNDEEEENNNQNQTTTQPSNPTPTPSDADGVCVSIKSSNVTSAPGIGDITTFIGLAVAVFPDGSGNFVNAGAVSCNTKALTRNDNNSYTFTPSQSDPTGIDFDNSNDWDVAGGGGVTGFTYSNSTTFPEIGDLTVDGTVDVGSELNLGIDLTANSTDLNNPDSVYFGVYGPDGQLFVAKGGNATSHTFSAGDLGTVGTGTGYVQVAAVIFNEQTISSQNIYFVNEGVMTKTVTFE